MKKCAICSSDTQGGRLCLHCQAALKRARDETVSQCQLAPAWAMGGPVRALPASDLKGHTSYRPVGKAPARRALPAAGVALPGAPRATDHAAALPIMAGTAPRTTAGTRLVWLIVLLMVAVVGWVAYRVIATAVAQQGLELAAASAVALPAETSAEAAREEQPAVDAQAEAAPPVVTGPDPFPAAEPSIVFAGALDRAPPATPRDSARPGHAPAPARRAPAPVRPAPAPAAALSPPSPPALATAVPRLEPREAPRKDRWQRMSAALAQCANENFFARLVCDQRIRLQFCDGQWGKAAQCPAGVANDHGS